MLRSLSLLAMTARHDFAISPRLSREFCFEFLPLKIRGRREAGCPMHPQPRVQNKVKHTSKSPQVHRKHPGLPCAMVYGLYALSPVSGLSSHRRLRFLAQT